jgi:hypothetical protein
VRRRHPAAPLFERVTFAFGDAAHHTSNGHHQRVSVSVVARPRNHFHYNSLTVPV